MQNSLSKAGAKILIIDDDINTTRLLENLLAKEGYKTTSVINSTSAFSIANSERPDLILLDLNMPDIDGIELCRMFCADQVLSTIPIVVFTAMGDIKNKVAAFNAGAKDYITKPVHREELKLRIRARLQASSRTVTKHELTQ